MTNAINRLFLASCIAVAVSASCAAQPAHADDERAARIAETCATIADGAAVAVTARDRGISLADVEAVARENVQDARAQEIMVRVARAAYTDPAFSLLTPAQYGAFVRGACVDYFSK
ncbi:hypothetical protein P0E55_13970 [Enterococcus faecalis]|jgi:hypothetical protein|nr:MULTISPECIES: hypothetical protein [Enterococcus]ELG7156320.1 hypothetical protein [Staphylococcus aureus]DAH95912.1 MAG TPA: hypothetical protein [Caudoviricetes sp.]MDN3040491.1 hypothetical protein [Enterococcus faecium]MDN3098637.1 hypothetical protein [Enterococcus faecalis]MDN3160810.1 hypothetical protein [Enterococcus faecalis]